MYTWYLCKQINYICNIVWCQFMFYSKAPVSYSVCPLSISRYIFTEMGYMHKINRKNPTNYCFGNVTLIANVLDTKQLNVFCIVVYHHVSYQNEVSDVIKEARTGGSCHLVTSWILIFCCGSKWKSELFCKKSCVCPQFHLTHEINENVLFGEIWSYIHSIWLCTNLTSSTLSIFVKYVFKSEIAVLNFYTL